MSKNTAPAVPGCHDLIIELGCEELPPKALDELREAWFSAVCAGLASQNLAFDAASSQAFSSPRRLALLLRQVASQQPDQHQQRRGPAVSAAFDGDGKPTGAALGFARSVGLPVDALETLKTDKGEWLVAEVHQAGKSLDDLLFDVLQQALRQLPVPRPMRWGSHEFNFVRPAHWLLVVHGERVLAGSLLGLHSDRLTRGHRIHAPGPHALKQAGDYLDVLRQAYVLADQAERKATIERQLRETDPAVRIDQALLDEVNNLVEWPVAVACSFDEDFLQVPHEALVASMQDHQKFFPVHAAGDEDAAVSNRFIAVANLESRDVSQVREGFERVIRPRLADARFFLEQDHKQPLEAQAAALDRVVFQEKIGTIGDKTRRISAVSKKIADKCGFDTTAAERAAQLSKCDLMTQMVGEFPELQGTMGRHYALHNGEPPAVAEAIEQHYRPRFAGDSIPAGPTGQMVGLADRADTLVGVFAAGQKPTGNKDPFALRRSALGLVRILLEARLNLSLDTLLVLAANQLTAQADKPGIEVKPALLAEVREFILERARNYFREQGFAAELVTAAMASPWHNLPDLHARLQALADFMGEETGLSLAAANKRSGNILRKAECDISLDIDNEALTLDEERELYQRVAAAEKELAGPLANSDYSASLERLAQLRPAVDRFFDAVMVMDEDPRLRANRLALLARMKALFDQVADLSVLG